MFMARIARLGLRNYSSFRHNVQLERESLDRIIQKGREDRREYHKRRDEEDKHHETETLLLGGITGLAVGQVVLFVKECIKELSCENN